MVNLSSATVALHHILEYRIESREITQSFCESYGTGELLTNFNQCGNIAYLKACGSCAENCSAFSCPCGELTKLPAKVSDYGSFYYSHFVPPVFLFKLRYNFIKAGKQRHRSSFTLKKGAK